MDTVRRLCVEISQYLYSIEQPPMALNDLWLAWVERGHVPTPAEIRVALRHPSPDER